MENSCHYSVYVDSFVHGELEESRPCRDFENHLATCNECKEEIKAVSQVKEALINSYSMQLDETFNYHVLNTLRKGKHFEERKEIRIAVEDIIISFATLLAVVLLGIQLFHNPKVSSVEMAGRLTNIEKSSLEQSSLSKDQVLELVLRSK
ncbi:MAG: hypothetical protein M1470_11450 [Bacteroidetes bacterium]|nr:hypothetical protein [Bacteroidota bacterium]MCL5737608.1 hypothetical protein [Bacteroidota bacterium]